MCVKIPFAHKGLVNTSRTLGKGEIKMQQSLLHSKIAKPRCSENNMFYGIFKVTVKDNMGSLPNLAQSVSDFTLQSHSIYEGGGQSFPRHLTFNQVYTQSTHYFVVKGTGC